MSGVPFDDSGLESLTGVARNMVVGMADFLKAILAQIARPIVEILIPLAAVLILTGSILYFSRLKESLGRNFVIHSIVLAMANQIFK